LGGRIVRVVLADGDGAVGELIPLEVQTPWWPDVLPIVGAYPGLAVLRLLEATPATPDANVGGEVTYLAEWLPRDLAPARAVDPPILPWHGVLHDDALRLPWARPGGPVEDLRWASGHVERSGPPVQYRTWNLSAIWTIPTPQGEVWLKTVPPFLQHEPAILELLAGGPVPRLIAASGHRQLLEALPGEDGYHATLEEYRVLIDELVALECSTIGAEHELLALGVPDRRWEALLAAATAVVERHLPEHRELRRLLDEAAGRVAAIEACRLPNVLVHGDAHSGNARIGPGAGRGIWFDWGDARVGHPLLDLGVLERPGVQRREALTSHWLDAWKAAVPRSDPHRAWPLVRPLAALGDAVVYQGFLDAIEATERIYHQDDVMPCLLRAARLAAE